MAPAPSAIESSASILVSLHESPQIHNREDCNPDHVNKVPIHWNARQTYICDFMLIFAMRHYASSNDKQNQSNDHVKAMEACQRKESAAEHIAANGQIFSN